MACNRPVLESVLERCRAGGEGFDCFAEGGRHRLQLYGALPRAWAGNLGLQCFASRIDIESADAMRISSNRWAASFVLNLAGADASAVRSDFMMMARREPRIVPVLADPDIEVAVVEDQSGSVLASVTGKDSTGLLAEVLRRFESFGLSPRRFSLRSEAGLVNDWFWLDLPTTSISE